MEPSALETLAWMIPATLMADAIAARLVINGWVQARGSAHRLEAGSRETLRLQAERIEALEGEMDALRRRVNGLAEAEAFHIRLGQPPNNPAGEAAQT